MTAAPWLKFYPSDWRGDPALRMCSIAARGLWMEMLCIMHEAEPRGFLLVNSKAVTDRQLASLSGITPREAIGLAAELEAAGVFSRDDKGTVYSRRMVRDQEKAERDKANGKGGGNPALKRADKRGVNPQDKAHIPEARGQTPEGESPTEAYSPTTNGATPEQAGIPALPPDTGCAAVWLSRGWQHDVIVAVLASKLPGRRKPPRSWSYFEEAIAEEHERRASSRTLTKPEAEQEVTPERREAHWRRLCRYHFNDEWSVQWKGRPGDPEHIITEEAAKAGKPWPPEDRVHH
jgi:hypothetical protein